MKQTPKFDSLAAIALEKKRLQKAIAQQERTLILHLEEAKTTTRTALSPLRIVQNLFGQFFSLRTLQNNPIASFKLGYKLIGYFVKKIRAKK